MSNANFGMFINNANIIKAMENEHDDKQQQAQQAQQQAQQQAASGVVNAAVTVAGIASAGLSQVPPPDGTLSTEDYERLKCFFSSCN